MRVRFTPSARIEFLGAIQNILEESPSAAARFRKRVEAGLSRLRRFPDSGRAVPEFPDLPHRELIVPPYRLFYRVVGKTIWVVAFWHGARIPQEPISESEEGP